MSSAVLVIWTVTFCYRQLTLTQHDWRQSYFQYLFSEDEHTYFNFATGNSSTASPVLQIHLLKKPAKRPNQVLIWSNFVLVPTRAAIIPPCKYPLWKINIHVENELKSWCVFKCNLDNHIFSRVVEHTDFHSVQVKKWDHLLNDCWPSRAEGKTLLWTPFKPGKNRLRSPTGLWVEN